MPHFSFDALFSAQNLGALVTLTALEIVLGIDNIIFIAILVGKLPPEQRDRARLLGLGLAMFMRIGLLLAISWVMGLDKNVLFDLPWEAHDPHAAHAAAGAAEAGVQAAGAVAAAAGQYRNPFTGKDVVLVLGGLFLVFKSVYEIHHKIEDAGEGGHREVAPLPREGPAGTAGAGAVQGGYVRKAGAGFAGAIVQILLLDLVFSLDSVITAVGMAREISVMIGAVVIAVGVMLLFSGVVARFVERHPTIKMLALSFLILIGVMLVADGTGWHVPKGYIYFAMAFALGVEMLNIWMRARSRRAAAH
jgi:predicted tellurium resistance membrane protein TerC